LESREHASITNLAAAVGVDRSYLRPLTTLNFLASGIVEVLFRGDSPDGLILDCLTPKPPHLWRDQRGLFPDHELGKRGATDTTAA